MSNNAPTVSQTTLPKMMAACAAIRKPLMVWGSPGVGKSDAVRQYAASIEAHLIDIRLAQYDAVDIRGLPDVDPHGRTVWRPPSTLPLVGSSFPTDKPVVLFLDELLQAAPAVQAVAFQLVLDRAVGEHKLMPNVIIIAASNRDTDRAGVGKMLTPLANRFAHVEVMPDLDSWKAWAMEAGVHPLVIGYLNARPDNLDQFEAAQKSGAKAFATPRAWAAVGETLAVFSHNESMCSLMASAIVGEAVASEFNAFRRVAGRLPTMEAIVTKPTKARVPKETDALYAVSSMLMVRANKDNLKPVIAYMQRLPMEYQTLWLADVSRSRTDLVTAGHDIVQYQIALSKKL